MSQRATLLALVGAVVASAAIAYVVRRRQRMAVARQSDYLSLTSRKGADGAAGGGEPVQRRAVRVPIPKNASEPTSFANFQEVEAVHMAIEWNVDFDRKVLTGQVAVTVKVKRAGSTQVVLDTHDLAVTEVRVDGLQAEYSFGPKHSAFGTALKVTLPGGLAPGTELRVEVAYETSVSATAIQWLAPEQTVGKVHPYLFTQCQSIHARSMLPCQDAPCVKTTFEARVTVRAPLVALMSGVSVGSRSSGSHTTFSFRQDIPVPSYLIALAVGNLESRDIGPRSRIWSEPSVVDMGAAEFVDTEMYLSAAEDLCGEYVWGRYDMLMLPPSFPYGGMENPCLTFITPTLLAGDRSLSNVVAHEVAHSWSGNLATNASWSSFWMNEGFTVFVERRILTKLFGERFAALKMRAGWANLVRAVDRFGHDHNFTRLHIDMDDVDPDDCFSPVSYEKGCAFVHYLEKVAGGPAAFEPFLKAYFLRFQFGVVSWDQLKLFYNQYFLERGLPQSELDKVDWEAWVYDPGMPVYKPEMDTYLIDIVAQVATVWIDKGEPGNTSLDAHWNSDQKVIFLEHLLEHLSEGGSFAPATVDRIDSRYNFSTSGNSEILFKWCLFALQSGAGQRYFAIIVRFVSDQGRMKFVRPIYRALLESGEEGRAVAKDAFEKNSMSYHSIARKMIERDLQAAGVSPSA